MTDPASHDVQRQRVEPRLLAAVVTRLPVSEIPQRFSTYLDRVYAASRAGLVQLDGQNVFLYHTVHGSMDVTDASFGVGALAPFTPADSVIPVTLPAGLVAMTTHWGEYSGLRRAHQAVIAWCAAQGHVRTGTRWEVYAHWDPDPSRIRTDVYHLLQE